jgi:hypothetical protein
MVNLNALSLFQTFSENLSESVDSSSFSHERLLFRRNFSRTNSYTPFKQAGLSPVSVRNCRNRRSDALEKRFVEHDVIDVWSTAETSLAISDLTAGARPAA